MSTRRLSRTVVPLLALSLLAGCESSNPRSEAFDAIEPIWSYDAPGHVRGVAVAAGGEVVAAVTPGEAPFEDGGGAVIFDEDGGPLALVPMVVPKDCDICTRLMFYPGAPLAMPGGDVWLGDLSGNLFRLSAGGEAERIPLRDPDWLGGGIFGLDSTSALAPDGERIFLAGLRLLVVETDGRISRAVDFGTIVRKIVRGDGAYWLDVTEPFSSTGAVVRWDPETDARASIELPNPVVGLASAGGWTVAAVEAGIGRVALYELGASGPVALSEFDLPSGPVHLALRPTQRQVVAASGGIGVAGDDGVTILVGGAVLVDADDGPIAAAAVSSVSDVALSADGSLAFVADSGGLKAFSLP